MTTTLWRYSVDFEKEEDWLNEQSAKGLALTHFALCRYTFEDCEPGEYIYRLELLDYPPAHPESQKYLSFLAEQGVEYICPWMCWVYLRKKAADGPFDLYSEIDSQLTHYRRITRLLLPLAAWEAVIGLSNIYTALLNWSRTGYFKTVNLVFGALFLLISAVLLIASLPTLRKIKRLRQEKNLRE